MAQQTIGIGSSANDGTGDPVRTAFGKVNSNFTELYSLVVALGGGPTAQRTVNIGAVANDLTGDPGRTAFNKVNNNFSALYAAVIALEA